MKALIFAPECAGMAALRGCLQSRSSPKHIPEKKHPFHS